jgi:hypothetical protein
MLIVAASAAAQSTYFPADAWGPSQGAWTAEERAQFYERWFGRHLAAMREPVLWEEPAEAEGAITRLLFLPSFQRPAMVRVTALPKGEMAYTFKALDGAGGYDPGNLVDNETGQVDPATARDFEGLLEAINPLSPDVPSEIKHPFRGCFDGTMVVLEVLQDGQYKAINRHECELSAQDDIRRLVNLLNRISRGRMIAPMTFVAR